MNVSELLSWLIPAGTISATLLIVLRKRWWFEAVGFGLLLMSHILLVGFGFTSDFGGFKYLQPFALPVTGYSFIYAVRRAIAARKGETPRGWPLLRRDVRDWFDRLYAWLYARNLNVAIGIVFILAVAVALHNLW